MCAFALIRTCALSQTAPTHVYDDKLYQFLEELNTADFTDQTFIAKPLNNQEVSNILFGIDTLKVLNKVLKQRLQYYKQMYVLEHSTSYPTPTKLYEKPLHTLSRFKAIDVAYYGEDKVAFTLNPIIGLDVFTNQNGQIIRRKIGGEFKMYIDKFTIYGSVRDHYESVPYTTYTSIGPHEGSLYKYNPDGSVEFSETRGGVSYNLGWGEIAFAKDHLKWGYGRFGTNILDASVPSFPHLKLRLYPKPWIRFEYVHAALQSNVLDSSSIYTIGGVNRGEFHNKFLASNLLSFRLKEKTWISLGNSIVYSQQNIEPAYLIPLAFYKSIDHYVANRNNYSGSNAQMFGAFSTRIIPKTHLYATLFVDEVSFRRMFDAQRHSNWYSINAGAQISNVLPNTTFNVEYLHTNAMVYKHFIETTTYANSYYTMGHYLGDNARQVGLQLTYSPLWWIDLSASYQFAQKGPDIKDDRVTKDPDTGILLVQGIKLLDTTAWQRNLYQFKAVLSPLAKWQFSCALRVQSQPVINRNYDIDFYSGNNSTFVIGLSYCY